jgi:hypothetical protein
MGEVSSMNDKLLCGIIGVDTMLVIVDGRNGYSGRWFTLRRKDERSGYNR